MMKMITVVDSGSPGDKVGGGGQQPTRLFADKTCKIKEIISQVAASWILQWIIIQTLH